MARAPKITEKRIADQIAAGYGIGFQDGYKPFLAIMRWNPSPISVQVRKPVPPFSRPCHFFSQSEWHIALLIAWAGAYVREQYPLWPWAHPHPEYNKNFEEDPSLPSSVGMLQICKAAGIRHGTFVGTNIPYIWTIDLCLTLPWVEVPSRRTCLISVKPLESERYKTIDPLDRGPEKLEAERRYAQQLGVHYMVGDASLYPRHIFGELESLADAAVLPPSHPWHSNLQRFLDGHGHDLGTVSLTETLDRLKTDYCSSLREATFLLNHMLWHQTIDCDLTILSDRKLPPRPGGRNFRSLVRKDLEGAKQ